MALKVKKKGSSGGFDSARQRRWFFAALETGQIKLKGKMGRWGIRQKSIDKHGNYIMYHGTTRERADSILKHGLNPVGAGDVARAFTLTSKKNVARRFAQGYGGNVVIKVKIPKDQIVDNVWPGAKTSAYQKRGTDTQHALKKVIDPKYLEEDIKPPKRKYKKKSK